MRQEQARQVVPAEPIARVVERGPQVAGVTESETAERERLRSITDGLFDFKQPARESEQERAAVLIVPHYRALADRLEICLRDGVKPLPRRVDPASNAELWRAFHVRVATERPISRPLARPDRSFQATSSMSWPRCRRFRLAL